MVILRSGVCVDIEVDVCGGIEVRGSVLILKSGVCVDIEVGDMC